MTVINLADEHLAINKKVLENNKYGIPFEFEDNQDNSLPNELSGRIFQVRGPGTPVTLGPKGEDSHVGFIQIDLISPKNNSLKELLDKASEISNSFSAGQRLTEKQTQLRITSLTTTSPRLDGNYRKISITANYEMRVNRVY